VGIARIERCLGRWSTALQPLGIEAALAGIKARSLKRSEKRDQLDFALRQARFEAARAHRQYDAINPDNRLVAEELERRWNERLAALRSLETEINQLDAGTELLLITSVDRERLMALGRDVAAAWDSSGATPETRKKIIRAVITEIVVDVVGETLEMVVHWRGGDHTRLTVKSRTDWCTEEDVIELVRALARHMPDQTIAAVLNRLGKSTSHGHSWTRGSVCSLRHQYDIAIHRPGERAERPRDDDQ
jgi:hypothetical protein